MELHHRDAATAWADDVLVLFEHGRHTVDKTRRLGVEAGVVSRLATTRLGLWEFDDTAKVSQRLHHSDTDAWKKRVRQTGDEETDAQQ